MDISKYKELFNSEAAEILQTLNNLLIQLEKTPASRDILNEIFRMAHTLKGMAATMNYTQIVKLSHEIEDRLDTLRENPSSVDGETCSWLFRSFDALSRSVAEPEPFAERRMVRINDGDKTVIAQAAEEETLTYTAKIVLNKDCAMPEARAFVILKVLKDSGKILNEGYVHNQIKTVHFGKSFVVFFMTNKGIAGIKKEIKSIPDVAVVDIELIAAGTPKTASQALGIRVPVEQLDTIFNLVGELVINKTQLETIAKKTANEDLTERLSITHRLMSELQMEVMNARLFPMSTICDQFPRLVRDMALSEGKEVDLEISGAEIGLDRFILDVIKDPLIHILRNSVGHGIEMPDIRRQQNKSPKGLIKIKAKREGGRVLIEVTDDGRGMDIERIKDKAVAMNLISSEKAAQLSGREALMLVCAPGLSTAQEITVISGRGVGMDIVKEKVELVGGSFSIETEASKGSRFTIDLPVSLAIVKGLMVRINGQTYAIPVSNIVRVMYGDPRKIKDMPLISMREVFGFKQDTPVDNTPIVIVDVNKKSAGLMVDGLVNQQEMIVKALDRNLSGIRGISGTTILGTGKVALIIDVPALV